MLLNKVFIRLTWFLIMTIVIIACQNNKKKSTPPWVAASNINNNHHNNSLACASWTPSATKVTTITLTGSTFFPGTDQIYYYNGYLYTLSQDTYIYSIEISTGSVTQYDTGGYSYLAGVHGSTLYAVGNSLSGIAVYSFDLSSSPSTNSSPDSTTPLSMPVIGSTDNFLLIRMFGTQLILSTALGYIYSLTGPSITGNLPTVTSGFTYFSFDIDPSTGIGYSVSSNTITSTFNYIYLNNTRDTGTFTNSIAYVDSVHGSTDSDETTKHLSAPAAFDGAGCLFFADVKNVVIKKTSTSATAAVSLVAGNSTNGVALSRSPGSDGSSGIDATFAAPSAIAYGVYQGAPALFVMDVDGSGNANLRVIHQ